MIEANASPPSPARSLLITALILVPGVLAAALELRHPMTIESLRARICNWAILRRPDSTRNPSPAEVNVLALYQAKDDLSARVQSIARLKRAQLNPAEALAEAGRRIPRGFAVTEITCSHETSVSGSDWLIVVHGDPTDAEAASWAAQQSRVGARLEFRLPLDVGSPEGVGWPPPVQSPWW